jgi:hypothetical protein
MDEAGKSAGIITPYWRVGVPVKLGSVLRANPQVP